MRILLRSKEQWLDFLDQINLDGVAYVASHGLGDDGAPTHFPVLVKGAQTTVYDDNNEPLPAFLITVITLEDATELLDTRRGLENYQYAEAL